MLLAEFTPLSAHAQLTIVSVLIVAGMVVQIAANLYNARRKPPIDAELIKLQSAIDTLTTGVRKLHAAAEAHAGHEAEIGQLKEEVRELKAARERDLAAARDESRETAQELFRKIDELKDSTAANLRAVERAIGQLEGR